MKDFMGSARKAALENIKFILIPHRTDDGQDTEDSWVWKLQRWNYDEETYEWNLAATKLL